MFTCLFVGFLCCFYVCFCLALFLLFMLLCFVLSVCLFVVPSVVSIQDRVFVRNVMYSQCIEVGFRFLQEVEGGCSVMFCPCTDL